MREGVAAQDAGRAREHKVGRTIKLSFVNDHLARSKVDLFQVSDQFTQVGVAECLQYRVLTQRRCDHIFSAVF